MNRDVFTELSDMRILVAKLSEQNAALRAKLEQTWQPVPSNIAIDCECGGCYQMASNTNFGIMVSRRTEIITLHFDNVRLCQRMTP